MRENTIFVKKYDADDKRLQIREREIWRYAGYSNFERRTNNPPLQMREALSGGFGGFLCPLYNGVDEELQNILKQVVKESEHKFTYKVCYRRMKIKWINEYKESNQTDNMYKTTTENVKSLERIPEILFLTQSKDLAKCLNGSEEIIIFAATIGLEADRYIAKYQRFSPVKALLMQAYGAERIECLCDVFCKEIKEEVKKEGLSCTARFSPGYGDLALEVQKEIFQLLDCQRQIGLTLNDSLLMTPSKSVTAILGLGACVDKEKEHKCKICKKSDCVYKKL